MKKLINFILLFVSISILVNGQRKVVHLPDLPGYVTLKCDLHLHTVFSDGNVWPTIRVDEALRDGLDAIAITDHLDYFTHTDYIKTDHNAGWKVTELYAKERNIILVQGTEIGRDMPPGHVNALFIHDATSLVKDSVWDAFEAAIQQGAFLMWNHPGWKHQQPDGIPRLYDIHLKMIEKGWLHGIEFLNFIDYYPLVLEMCKEHNLAVMGSSDMHGLISETYKIPEYTNRPMTLVFAKERSHDALREALFAGRTLVWFHEMIAGRVEYAKPFFYGCISVSKIYYENDKKKFFEVTNHSDIPFSLINGKRTPKSVVLEANSVTRIAVSKDVVFPITYEVSNVLIGENEYLKIELE